MYVLCKSSEIWLLFRNSWISSGKTCFKPLDPPPESKPLAHPWHLCLELQETAQVLPKFKGTIWSHKRFCMANIEVGTKASLLFMAVVPHLLRCFFFGFGEQKRHNPTNPLEDAAQRLVSKWHTLGRTPTSQGSIKQLSQGGIFTQDDCLLQWQIVLGPKEIIIQERPARGLKAWNGNKKQG